jgi:hypothetical protein
MPEKATSNQPLFAEIIKSLPYDTMVRLVIFGMDNERIFSGPDHYDNAVEWVNKWNTHLSREWMDVRETTTLIMQDFVKTLCGLGVSDDIIDEAMKKTLHGLGVGDASVDKTIKEVRPNAKS